MRRFVRSGTRKGRGAVSNPAGRFAKNSVSATDDGWGILDEELPTVATQVRPEAARSIITRNDSPDIPFTQSINPYRGCEHGCIYCYARPSHAYVDLSPGLDFETQLFFKRDAASLLRRALVAPSYECAPIALGANTDPYQPIERKLRVTREILEVLAACAHPVTIVTKGAALIGRDIDLLGVMAGRRLVSVFVSITTLDAALKRSLEPRAASPRARLDVIERLARAGIPVGVMVAPIIPALTDHEIEKILAAAADAGARSANYVLLRLPHEVAPLFDEWLGAHVPLRAEHVRSRLRAMRGGRRNDPRFGARLLGEGSDAELLARRFSIARRRYGLESDDAFELDTTQFVAPRADTRQIPLF
jgi:DNA repair photolyase